MIDFIKEYGISEMDYEYIMNNLNNNIIENIALSENSIRDVLNYYNNIGITHELSYILVHRPDLVLISKDNLESLLSNIDIDLFKNLVLKDIDDLILLGI